MFKLNTSGHDRHWLPSWPSILQRNLPKHAYRIMLPERVYSNTWTDSNKKAKESQKRSQRTALPFVTYRGENKHIKHKLAMSRVCLVRVTCRGGPSISQWCMRQATIPAPIRPTPYVPNDLTGTVIKGPLLLLHARWDTQAPDLVILVTPRFTPGYLQSVVLLKLHLPSLSSHTIASYRTILH